MKIGVVSDTHNNLKNCRRIVEIFNEAGVAQVIHTGDITQAKTIEVFANLDMPMSGVFGNNDQERDSLEQAILHHGFSFLEPPLPLELAGRWILVVHDPLDFKAVDTAAFDVLLHGHTHRQVVEYLGGRLTFNPGECAGHMQGYNSVGILDLANLHAKTVAF